jgi:hypothetical protein
MGEHGQIRLSVTALLNATLGRVANGLLVLEPIARFENPPHGSKTQGQKQNGYGKADFHANV